MDYTIKNATPAKTNPSTAIATHAICSIRPRTLASWNTSAASHIKAGVPFGSTVVGFAAVEAVRGTGMRDIAALQGAPPRENPR